MQAPAQRSFSKQFIGTKATRLSTAFYGYSLTIIFLGVGWLLRDEQLITAKTGVGYWLGIAGGTMMLLLLLYPLRKRLRSLRFLGGTSTWFKTHMILGILGPVLVLFHANFQLGSFNSRIALFCMLAVAISGVIGRYIYAHIHKGLYGGKTTLNELRQDLETSLQHSHGLVSLMPEFSARLETAAADIQGDAVTGTLGTRKSLAWFPRQYVVWWNLHRTAMHELNHSAASSEAIAKDLKRLKSTTASFIRRFIRLSGRLAQFTLFERLFAFWHVAHLPLFLMMVISALVHVLAVHMY